MRRRLLSWLYTVRVGSVLYTTKRLLNEVFVMKFILQICSGAWGATNYAAEEIVARVETISSKIDVDRVIIGWSPAATSRTRDSSWAWTCSPP